MDETNFRQPAVGPSTVTATTNKPFHTYENASYDGDEMLDIDIDGNATSNQANSQTNFSNITATTASATSNSSRPCSLPMARNTFTESPFPDPNNADAAMTATSSSVTGTTYPSKNGLLATKSPVMANAVNLVTKLMPSGNVTQSPMDSIKEWSVSTFKCTRQLVNERLGKCSKTSDVQLEADIERLRENQRKYTIILKTAQQMNVQYSQLVQTQRKLYELMNEMAMRYCTLGSSTSSGSLNSNSNGTRSSKHHHTNAVTVTNNLASSSSTTSLANSHCGISSDFSPVLNHIKMSSTINIGEDFRKNAMALSISAKNGEKLIAALRFFCSNLSTLITKTIDDTLTTVRAFESARLEYDAERNSMNCMIPTAQTSVTATSDKLDSARIRYEQLREDVQIKMKFLDENKLKVMHKQLVLFNSAFAAYASGNIGALEAVLKQFSIR